MTPTILKGTEWSLSAETGLGAPEAIYGVRCMTCASESGLVDDDPRPVGVWAIDHTRNHPSHRQHLLTTQKHWRVDPTPTRQMPAPEPGSELPPVSSPPAANGSQGRRTRHARRRSALVGRTVAYLGRYAGPLFIVALSAACGFVFGTLLTAGSD
ncbi:hypothetical protein [Streptomyces sp. NBC_01187]|uniref:DUF7848 domain-containing protein n=1 Tax=Streptomyces sp. NBC_01187 TaxID=2903766 RepID=UPI00386DEC3D|nr:hypothetical protein OG220_21620 [Streptomyces sp. NBC_01187]